MPDCCRRGHPHATFRYQSPNGRWHCQECRRLAAALFRRGIKFSQEQPFKRTIIAPLPKPSSTVINTTPLTKQVERLIPRAWPSHMRDDIAQDILLAIFAGELDTTSMNSSTVKAFTAKWRREQSPYSEFTVVDIVEVSDTGGKRGFI